MPRSHRITSVLPPARTYSADSSHSSIVAEMPRFSSTGLRVATELAQQREVLHVARADLEDVAVLRDHRSIWLMSITSDTSLRSCWSAPVAQHLQPVFAQALEAVGRAARLEGAAAQDLRAGALHGRGRRVHLLVCLGRARAGHDDHLVAADAHIADRHDRVFGLERAARELVRLRDPQAPRARRRASRAIADRPCGRRRPRRAPCARRRSSDARPCPAPPGARRPLRSAPPWRVLSLRPPCSILQIRTLGSRNISDGISVSDCVGLALVVVTGRFPLEAPRLVDDAFEQPRQRRRTRAAPHSTVQACTCRRTSVSREGW